MPGVVEKLSEAAALLIPALAGLVYTWIRVRKARLKAERLELPPSSQPPPPAWSWPDSLRPRRRRRRIEPQQPRKSWFDSLRPPRRRR